MLTLLKKPSDKGAGASMPAWHPNFRDAGSLPDTKVVRTSFFINGVAILAVLALAIYLAESEFELRGLRDQTATWREQIRNEKAGSDRAVAEFKKFQEEARPLLELKAFESAKIVGSDLLLQLGESLPPHIALRGVDYHGDQILLRGSVSGSPDEAIGDASAYRETLSQYPAFAGKFEAVTLPTISRNPAGDGITFEILMKFKSEPKKKEGKK